jgi:small GTP-binding protein
VGKSCLLLRLLDNKFTDNYESTLGVEFGSKIVSVGNSVVKLMVWDTAGQESFKSIIRSYYKK